MMKTHLSILASILILSACSNTNDVQTVKPLPSFTQFSEQVKQAKVVILTDHTLPEDLNLSSGGAQGRERDFIDPAADVFAKQLQKQGLRYTILKVEELIDGGKIDC